MTIKNRIGNEKDFSIPDDAGRAGILLKRRR
jgi:hypothetical protein